MPQMSNSPTCGSCTMCFCTLIKGIRVLGVPLGSFSFTSSFLQDALDNDVHHFNVFSKSRDVQVAFGIFIHCFAQKLYLFFGSFFPFSDFQHHFTSFDSTFIWVFGIFLGTSLWNVQKFSQFIGKLLFPSPKLGQILPL